MTRSFVLLDKLARSAGKTATAFAGRVLVGSTPACLPVESDAPEKCGTTTKDNHASTQSEAVMPPAILNLVHRQAFRVSRVNCDKVTEDDIPTAAVFKIEADRPSGIACTVSSTMSPANSAPPTPTP